MNFVSLEFAAFLAVVYDRLARAEEPVVRRLSAGGNEIRTLGPPKDEALNWTPCVRSLIQVPLAWTNSPAAIIAA
jgi:hypothetical protein